MACKRVVLANIYNALIEVKVPWSKDELLLKRSFVMMLLVGRGFNGEGVTTKLLA